VRLCLLSVVVVASLVATARAEDVASYDAEGDADSAGGDPRVAALDDAFGRAVSTALGDIVANDVRSQKRADLDREIVGHARLWVVKFTVTHDTTADDRRQLAVTVRVDRDKMRARLAELSIPTLASRPTVDPRARPVAVLLRVTTPAGIAASYGATADKGAPGTVVLDGALRQVGMTAVRAPSSGPPAKSGGEFSVDDDEAEALATAAHAELAMIAAVDVGPPVTIRGQSVPGSLVTARIRMIEAKGHRLLGAGTAIVAARGDGAAQIDRALVAAATDVLPPAPKKLATPAPLKGDDLPVAESGIVNVRLPAKTPWGMVLTEQRFLEKAKGVTRVTLRRVSPAGYVLGLVTSEPIDRIASIARKPPATDTAVIVKVVGDVVEVALSGAP
jgi:hypothetical protein